MINIAIVENDDLDYKSLFDSLNRYSTEKSSEFSIKRFSDAQSFLTQYDFSYNLVFMDIMLGDLNGLEASKKLREIDKKVTIVFFTNMASLVIEGYKVNAADFIIKPISYWNFELVLDRILPSLILKESIKFVVNGDNGKTILAIEDIVFVRIHNHTLYFQSFDQQYTLNSALKSLGESLFDLGFALSDSSYLVNLRYVVSIKSDTLIMKNNMTVPISRRKRKNFLSRLSSFIGEKL